MTSSIRSFWNRLSGQVHPSDQPIFEQSYHSFNLDFPPPAFIGDVDTAPVVILMSNGGYDSQITPAEFIDPCDRAEFIQYLRGERTDVPTNLSGYYRRSRLWPWIVDRQVAVVNAVAYRSFRLSQEPHNQRVAEKLPSVAAHRHWLRTELLPSGRAGTKLIVAHRNGLWRLTQSEQNPGVLFSTNPASPHLSQAVVAQISAWLKR